MTRSFYKTVSRLVCLVLFVFPFVTFGQGDAVPLWQSKFDSAQFLWKTNSMQSVRFLKDAERIAFHDLGIYDENYLTILNDLGIAYGQVRDYTQAERYLTQSLQIQNELYSNDDTHVLQARCNLAAVVLKSGDDRRAKNIYRDVMNRSTQSPANFILAAQQLAGLYEKHEQLDSALVIAGKALALKNESTVAESQLTDLYLTEGRLLRKMKKFDDARQVLQTLRHPASESEVTEPLMQAIHVEESLIDIEMGLYGKAEKEMLALYRALKVSPGDAESLLTEVTNGLAYLYDKLGIYDKALAYYQESLNRCVHVYGYSSMGCLIIQNNIAGVYLKQGMVRESLDEYERFIQLYSHYVSEDHPTYLTALNNLATAYRQSGQYDLALNHFEAILEKMKQKGDQHTELAATVMNNIAVTYTLQGKNEQATPYFERVLAIKQSIYGTNSSMLMDITASLAVSYWITKRFEEAMPLFTQSLELARREVKYFFPNLTEGEQIQFYRKQKENFERFNTLAIQSGIRQNELLTHLFDNQLLLKSLVFFTNRKKDDALEAGNESLKQQVEQTHTKAVQLGHFYQMPSAELQRLGVSLSKLENEIDSLEKSIRLALRTQEVDAPVLQWRAIQQQLSDDEALVDIVRFRKYDVMADKSGIATKQVSIGFTDTVYYAALITTKETITAPVYVLLKNGVGLEQRYLSYYRNALKFDIEDTVSYAHFWQPIENKISNKQRVYLSSDGVFHKINLNAIRDREGKFVLEKYDLYPILNAGQLAHRQTERSFDFSNVMLMGDPTFASGIASEREVVAGAKKYEALPGSREELNGIVAALKIKPSASQVLLRDQASELNLRKVASPSILHIATHGFFSSDMVYVNDQTKNDFLFYSGLVLSPGTSVQRTNTFDTDGIITAYDIMNLDLRQTELVVLSACETGLGKVENSEGVYGLQRSFLQAGASDVLISLWKVEDMMTKELMVKFYTYLGQQMPRRAALKNAQLDLLHQVGNPRQWAAFQLIGSN